MKSPFRSMSSGKQNTSQYGFTIVELMIATVVFSIVLLVCTAGLLQISRMYYRGIVSSRTQEVTRSILDDVSEAIRLGGGTVVPQIAPVAGPVDGSCAGGKRYSYQLHKQMDESIPSKRHVLMSDDLAVCSSGTPAQDINSFVITGEEMMANGMRLEIFHICKPGDAPVPVVCPNPPPAGSNLYKVTIRVVSGEDGLLVDADGDGYKECKLQSGGGQFCAVSELTTTVQKRL